MKPAILGISGPALTPDEAVLFRLYPPAGVILFARNIQDPAQLTALITQIRAVLPHATIMVDQEGGRVARLRPPGWDAHPAAADIGALPPDQAQRAAWLTGALIGTECSAAGITAVCAPVLDRRIPGAHDVIGDRAYGESPQTVATLGHAMAVGLLAAGVQPVGKHAPGHGQAAVDSHLGLPTVPDATDDDLHPFLANADLPWLMTAHIVYAALDTLPATLSPTVIQDVLRGRIGFDGLLLTDDLHMGALEGLPGARAAAALAAGCDIALHCSGMPWDNVSVLASVGVMPGRTAQRLAAAQALAARCRQKLDPAALRAERAMLLPCLRP